MNKLFDIKIKIQKYIIDIINRMYKIINDKKTNTNTNKNIKSGYKPII